jgi:hypothetical protein
MYRQWRGPLRVKIVINGLVANQVAKVYWHPYYRETAPSDAELRTLVSTGTASLGNNSSFPISSTITTSALPTEPVVMAMAASPLTVLECEIPFTSRYQSLLTGAGASTTANYQTEINTTGYLVITITPAQDPGVKVQADIYMALGDEARMGTLYQVPHLFTPGYISNDDPPVFTGPIYPTTYTLPALTELEREKEKEKKVKWF